MIVVVVGRVVPVVDVVVLLAVEVVGEAVGVFRSLAFGHENQCEGCLACILSPSASISARALAAPSVSRSASLTARARS